MEKAEGSPKRDQRHTGRCFSCKEQTEMSDIKSSTTVNNKRRLAGKCSKCGKQMSTFVKK